MADWLKEYIGQLKDLWSKLNKRIKIVAGIVIVAVIVGLIMLMLYGNGPQYQPLFSNLTPKDADSITEKLDEQGVQYQLANDGKMIMVPATMVYKTRLKMAGEGLPTQGVVGFEIFDKSSFGTTDFERKVNYYRALGGELSRSIQAMDAVEYAKVQITAPKDSLFIEEEQSAQASVLLKLITNYKITQPQIKAIINLVAAAVQGLEAKNVTVVDTGGNLLTDYLQKDDSSMFDQKLTINQFELQRQLSDEIRNDLRAMLTRVAGPDNFTVQVKAKMNFDYREVNSKTYTPVVGDEGIVRSQQEKKENYQGNVADAVGVPGTTSNIPQYQSVDQGGGTGTYSSSDMTTNYEINEKVEHLVYSPGNIEQLSVAVVINNNLSEEDLNKIQSAVQAAVGYNPERGDIVTVTSLNFDKSIEEEIATAQAAEAAAQKTKMLIYAGLIGFILMILLISLFILRRPRKKEEQKSIEKALDYIVDDDLEEQIAATAELTSEQKKRMKIKEQLTNLVNEKPEEITDMIKSWLVDE